ncbi:MAG: hypothetical protein ACK4UN_15615 [Limisphaerales bacterium]
MEEYALSVTLFNGGKPKGTTPPGAYDQPRTATTSDFPVSELLYIFQENGSLE